MVRCKGGGASWGPCQGILFSWKTSHRKVQYRLGFILSMRRGIKMVAVAEKGGEGESREVEADHDEVGRGGKGRWKGRAQGGREKQAGRLRVIGWGKQPPFFSGPGLPDWCQITAVELRKYDNFWDPHKINCTPQKRLGHFYSSCLCSTLGSGHLHSTTAALLAAHTMWLASSIFCVLLWQLGLTAFLSMLPSCCQDIATLYANIMPSKPITQGWF